MIDVILKAPLLQISCWKLILTMYDVDIRTLLTSPCLSIGYEIDHDVTFPII